MNKLCLTLSLLFLLHLVAFSQGDSARLMTIATKLTKLSATHPTEKIYLHFNKPGYNTGDTIWFKGYLTIGEYHMPSALSGILYLDMIDSKDKIVKSLQLKAVNGISTGDIALSDKLPTGDYRIRAYTNWMRNAGPNYFFNKTISIGNAKTAALFVKSSYTVSTKNNEQSIKTNLVYTDKFGRPYDRKEVTYEVRADTNLLYKGKSISDSKGNITFTFPGKIAPGQKRINIINHVNLVNGIIVDKTIPFNPQKQNIDIQFFPEGGQLINNVRSKVAFKTVGMDGLGTDVHGVVTDNANNEVAYFSSQHAGMGVFALTPQTGKSYTAKVTLADSTVITTNLPLAQENGFVLAVNSIDSLNLNVRIATNPTTLEAQPNAAFYLIGQSAGKIYYTTFGRLDNTSCVAVVPKNKFPSGIAQFTLFSSTGEPLNERIVFIQNATDLLNLNLSADKTTYAQKEKVNITLNAKDNTNQSVIGSFSLAVFNEDRLTANENAESSILSNILLMSDLRGYVEEPNYYFNQASNQTNADLDVLMLTQGYHRFEWKSLLEDHMAPTLYEPEKSLSISGQLTTQSGKPIANGRLGILALDAKAEIDTVTDANGRFVLNDVALPDSAKLVIQARKANDGRNVNISLDNNRTVPVIFKSDIGDVSENLVAPLLKMMNAASLTGNADTSHFADEIKAALDPRTDKTLKEVDIKAKVLLAPTRENGWGTQYQYNLSMEQANGYNWISDAIKWKVPFRTNISHVYVNGLELPRSYLAVLSPADVESITIVDTNKVFITTKSYAGTDTIKINNIANSNILKDVNIKAHQSDKPDQSNLWGSVRPNLIVKGDALEDYVDIAAGLQVKGYNFKALNGRLYDLDPAVTLKAKAFKALPRDIPIPFVINGVAATPGESMDIMASLIEDVKIVEGEAVKALYGIDLKNPNNKVILITTKQFAGTDTVKNDIVKKNNTLKQVNIKDKKIDKPDQSNLWGSVRADAIITGDQLQDYTDIVHGMSIKVPSLFYQEGRLYDPVALKKPIIPDVSPPVPVVINGLLLDRLDKIDDKLNINEIEDIKVMQAGVFRDVYNVPTIIDDKKVKRDPNDKIIIITTKQFAGVAVSNEKADTLKRIDLKQVNIKNKTLKGNENAPWKPVVTNSANLNGPGNANQVFTQKDLEYCIDFLECLMNKIPGVQRKDGEYSFVRHSAQSLNANPIIKFMLDGVFVTPGDLQSVNIGNVETVEVLNSSSYLNVYGTSAPGGLIIVTTRMGSAPQNDAIAYKSVPGVIYTKFNGYYKAKEFYTPKYTATNSNITDNRTAIYWNPNIITDASGKFTAEYFNSDVKGSYRAVVEGIDNDGNIGRYVYRYRVE
jgi:hypothetical protein